MELNEKIAQIVRGVFPSCNIISMEKIDRGFVNLKFLIQIANPEKELVFKFRKPGRLEPSHVLKEAGALRLVKKLLLDFPVPEIFFAKEADSMFDSDYVLMSKLPGVDLSAVWKSLNDDEKKQIIYQIGFLLAKLHTIKFDRFGKLDKNGAVREGKDSWEKYSVPNLFEELGRQEVLGVHPEAFRDEIIKFVRSKISFFASQKEPTLVHNDWHKDHFRVENANGTWKIVGILDFEFAEAAPKLYDFVKSDRWLFREEAFAKDAFMQGYKDAGGTIPENYEETIRIFQAHHLIWFLRRLVEGKDKSFEEYKQRLIELMEN